MKLTKRKFSKDQEGSNLSQFGGEPAADSFEGYMLSMALAYDNEPVASKTELKKTESNRLCTIEATCGIEGIRTPQNAEPGFIGIGEDTPNKLRKVSIGNNLSPISSSSTSSSSSTNHGTSKSDVQFLAHLKALTSNPDKLRLEEEKMDLERQKLEVENRKLEEKMGLERQKLEVENRRLTIMEQSNTDMKDFLKHTLDNQQALMLVLLGKLGPGVPVTGSTGGSTEDMCSSKTPSGV